MKVVKKGVCLHKDYLKNGYFENCEIWFDSILDYSSFRLGVHIFVRALVNAVSYGIKFTFMKKDRGL